MNKKKDLLDFCRVKKIFEKGFGFLTSMYFEENVFFHFSKIKEPEVKEALQNLERGVVYVFYTSVERNGKRRVKKLWTDIKKVDNYLIPDFVNKIVDEFESGKTNIFETANVIKQLRSAAYFDNKKFRKILELPKVTLMPTVITTMLTEEERNSIKNFNELIEKISNKKIPQSVWIETILNGIK